jgi:hypothetical protein
MSPSSTDITNQYGLQCSILVPEHFLFHILLRTKQHGPHRQVHNVSHRLLHSEGCTYVIKTIKMLQKRTHVPSYVLFVRVCVLVRPGYVCLGRTCVCVCTRNHEAALNMLCIRIT